MGYSSCLGASYGWSTGSFMLVWFAKVLVFIMACIIFSVIFWTTYNWLVAKTCCKEKSAEKKPAKRSKKKK